MRGVNPPTLVKRLPLVIDEEKIKKSIEDCETIPTADCQSEDCPHLYLCKLVTGDDEDLRHVYYENAIKKIELLINKYRKE